MSLQLDASASQLNSNDAFILVTPGGSFLWVGVGASDPEKQGAQQLCDILGVSASELSEGGETGEEKQPRQNNNLALFFLLLVWNQRLSPAKTVVVVSASDTSVAKMLKSGFNARLSGCLFVLS